MTDKPVAVTYAPHGAKSQKVIARFNTVVEAESFIADLADDEATKQSVERGDYGIDAPETMVNPRHRTR
jgi:hypothetical protein